jgi:hypothetical protein
MIGTAPISDRQFLDKWFAAGTAYPGVYVLGCFARYVTLYSQQLRALNLVGALVTTNQIGSKTSVAVIGGGVSGMTAALAAQRCGAKVTLIEKNSGFMDLQRNASKRWIHPHIYDWPAEEHDDLRAKLPILPWTADYADRVINDQFEPFRLRFRNAEPQIDEYLNVREVALTIESNLPQLTWNGLPKRWFDVVILAVGFGTETDGGYWIDDGTLDAWPIARAKRSLVVGVGDSGLTDLMRLCIKDFRHGEILKNFGRFPSVSWNSLSRDLRDIESAGYNAEKLSAAYEKLQTTKLAYQVANNLTLRDASEPVCVTSKDDFLYDPRACALNRFILKLLVDLKLVRHRKGYSNVARLNGRLIATFGEEAEDFDHVFKRFGPKSAMQQSFTDVFNACRPLRDLWADLRPTLDESRSYRANLWPAAFLKPGNPVARAQRQDIAVTARFLEFTKQVLLDGRSNMGISLDGLTVRENQISGLWLKIKSSVGDIGAPEPDDGARQLGAVWQPESIAPVSRDANLDERLRFARERSRSVSGVMAFNPPLTAARGPVRCGLHVLMLNSVASSSWEFDQFYDEKDRRHIDGSETRNQEYFARAVWMPLETFRMRLELPADLDVTPTVRKFRFHREVEPGDVIIGNVLGLSPRLRPGEIPSWIPADDDPANGKLTEVAPNTWELQVENPPVGFCFSLDWTLPTRSPDTRRLRIEQEVRCVQNHLFDHRWNRLEGRSPGPVNQVFHEFAERVRSLFGEQGTAPNLQLMAYNHRLRRLEMVEGVYGDGEPPPNSWNFWLPFGLGMGGACFKNPRAYLYVPPPLAARREPDYFLHVPGGEGEPAALLTLPLFHPEYEPPVVPDYDESVPLERGRECIGVVDIVSPLSAERLVEIATSEEQFGSLVDLCRDLAEQLFVTCTGAIGSKV